MKRCRIPNDYMGEGINRFDGSELILLEHPSERLHFRAKRVLVKTSEG